jgi:hypothetical protein
LLFLTACSNLQTEGAAAAILDAALPASRDHAAALVDGELDLIRSTGLELIEIVNCWPDGC